MHNNSQVTEPAPRLTPQGEYAAPRVWSHPGGAVVVAGGLDGRDAWLREHAPQGRWRWVGGLGVGGLRTRGGG
eukprot:1150961-Pelagomonas_calceolata.AAC.7